MKRNKSGLCHAISDSYSAIDQTLQNESLDVAGLKRQGMERMMERMSEFSLDKRPQRQDRLR